MTSGVLGVRFCRKIILSDTSSDSSPNPRKGEKHKLVFRKLVIGKFGPFFHATFRDEEACGWVGTRRLLPPSGSESTGVPSLGAVTGVSACAVTARPGRHR